MRPTTGEKTNVSVAPRRAGVKCRHSLSIAKAEKLKSEGGTANEPAKGRGSQQPQVTVRSELMGMIAPSRSSTGCYSTCRGFSTGVRGDETSGAQPTSPEHVEREGRAEQLKGYSFGGPARSRSAESLSLTASNAPSLRSTPRLQTTAERAASSHSTGRDCCYIAHHASRPTVEAVHLPT